MKFASLAALSMLALAPLAAKADEGFHPDCHMEGINRGLDQVREQIKSSPALGHAGGHYKRALEDIEKLRNQLHEGCRAFNHGMHR